MQETFGESLANRILLILLAVCALTGLALYLYLLLVCLLAGGLLVRRRLAARRAQQLEDSLPAELVEPGRDKQDTFMQIVRHWFSYSPERDLRLTPGRLIMTPSRLLGGRAGLGAAKRAQTPPADLWRTPRTHFAGSRFSHST